jgi:hypothetical protein
MVEIKVPFYSALVNTGNAHTDFLRRARQFWDAAVPMPDVIGADHNWPRLALLGHAAELAILGFLALTKDQADGDQRIRNHDLWAFYERALLRGLPPVSTEPTLQLLSELHLNHYARYPKKGGRQAMISSFDDVVAELIESVSTANK